MRRYCLMMVSVSICLMLALAACNDDDDAADDSDVAETEPTEEVAVEESTSEPNQTPTPKPEPTPTAEATSTPETEPTPTLEAVYAAEMTDGDLAGHLLALEDMPTGWITIQLSGDDSEDFDEHDAELICDSDQLEEVLDTVADAEVEFQRSELGPFLSQNLVLLPDQEQAESAMSTIQEMFSCTEWTTTDDTGDKMVWHLHPVSFSAFGDDTFASRVTTEIMGFSVEMNLVVVRQQSFVTMMVHWGIGGIDSEQTEEFVRRAVEKLPE